MGSGKTTVGRLLAEQSGMRFVDTDALLTERAGCPITEIFAAEGEAGFRDRETALLRELADDGRQGRVFATGGGMILRPQNRTLLHRLGTVVWLTLPPQEVLARLSGDTTRPLLQGADRLQKVERLMAEREPLYRDAADLAVAVAGRTPLEIVEELRRRASVR